MDLNIYDIETLRMLNGEEVPGYVGGAGTMECVKYLRRCGLVDRTVTEKALTYEINDAGRKFLAELKKEN